MMKRSFRQISLLLAFFATFFVISTVLLVPVSSLAQAKPVAGKKAGIISAVLPVATIDRGTGKNETTVEAKKGDDIIWNDLVKTAKGGRARITLFDLSVISLGSQAELRILQHDARTQQTALQLAYGRVRAEVASVTRDGGKFELRTPTAVAGVIGTDFGTDSSIPGVTTFLCIAGIVTVGNSDATVPGTVPCPAGSTTSVSTGLPPTPPKPATQQQIQQLIQDTEPTVTSTTLHAQAQPPFKVGDRVEADPMLIGVWRPATVIKVYMAEGSLNGYEIRIDAEGNREPEQYTVGKTVARGIRPIQDGGNAPPVQVAQNKRAATVTPGNVAPVAAPANQTRATTVGACSSDPQLTSGQKATDSMELSFKRALLGNYQKKVAEKSLSSPLAVGINFSNFQIGSPRRNQRTLDSTDGTYMRSAPVGADIYQVKTNFTECERFKSEIIRTVVDGRYECFKDNFGEWACSNASGWKTLETKREILELQ
jgi:hypothetical protein